MKRSEYSYYARNNEKDKIYQRRLHLIYKYDFDYNKTAQRYHYFMNAYLGIILIDWDNDK